VITASGPVTGSLDGSVYAWKGIPYAAPPIGDLRWKPPVAPACWTDEKVTTAFGPVCPQLDDSGQVTGDEDCLTLNVWAPTGATAAPVLVFIHGGGNTAGSASDAIHDGAQLAAQTGAVVVSFEYRLGALGFFANPALDAESSAHVSGNYGILDQIAVLSWVQANIAGFGGARDHVMLFGESAGAQDTLVHVASPLSKGLFASALVESGGSYRSTLADNENAMQTVVDAVGCTNATSTVDCMRGVPATMLASVASAITPLQPGLHYTPSIDGYVLADTVPNTIAAGAHNHVPLVLGTNADETSRMVPKVTTATEYAAALVTLYGQQGGSALLQLYPASSFPSPQQALVRATTDVTWTCPIRRLARAAADHQSEPVYRYHFSWRLPGAAGAAIGATHGLELPFVFRTFSALNYTPTASDLALSDSIEGYWNRLAATGDPNDATALAWPRYVSASDPYLELNTAITTGTGLAAAQCDALDALTP
jgi:para-nitrobenzyl esterase